MTGHTFTTDQRHALNAAYVEFRNRVAEHRMTQAELFCYGRDDLAARYDGPDGFIATAERHLRAVDEMTNAAYGIEVTQ